MGYTNTTSWLLNAADFGVPQIRKRAFIVGSLNKTPIEKITNEADEKILKLEVDVFRQDGTSTTPGFALVKLPK